MSVVSTRDLTRYFQDICAVDRVDLDVGNEIFGLLGPNGAGKSTVVKMLTTLLKPGKGEAYICGQNVVKEPVKVREMISYVPQEMAVDIKLTGRENVSLYADLYHVSNRVNRVDEVLAMVDLADRADDLVRSYSGGMRRRLELAQALVHEPRVLFLDEPTLGLDVAARNKIWEHILALRKKGMTVFLTTHYMDEADRYCDRVAIIDKGRIVVCGAPEQLKSETGGSVVTASVTGELNKFDLEGIRILGVGEHELTFLAKGLECPLQAITQELTRQGLAVHSLSSRACTLDDVFLDKVGLKDDRSGFDGSRYRLMLRRR